MLRGRIDGDVVEDGAAGLDQDRARRVGRERDWHVRVAAERERDRLDAAVAGAGIVEASTENIAIGAHVAGVVSRVHVRVGQKVTAGDPLFTVDDRAAKAELAVRKASLARAEQSLTRLRETPRPEDVPPAEARVAVERALVEDAKSQLALWESVTDPRAVAKDELNKIQGRPFLVSEIEAKIHELLGK